MLERSRRVVCTAHGATARAALALRSANAAPRHLAYLLVVSAIGLIRSWPMVLSNST